MPPKTIAKGKGKAPVKVHTTAVPTARPAPRPRCKEATEALKWLMMMGAGEEAVAHLQPHAPHNQKTSTCTLRGA